jgi:hypothetical protein
MATAKRRRGTGKREPLKVVVLPLHPGHDVAESSRFHVGQPVNRDD